MISLSTFAWDQDREEIGGEWEIRKQRREDRMGQVKGCLIHHYMEEQDPNPTTPQQSDFGTRVYKSPSASQLHLVMWG